MTVWGWTRQARLVLLGLSTAAVHTALAASVISCRLRNGGDLSQRRTLLTRAAGHWLFDAASLWVCLAAYGAAVLGVPTWRAMEFWLPIPVAGLAYLSLRLQPGRTNAGSSRSTHR